MPAPNPEAVHQRAIAAARQRTGQPIAPPLDPVLGANVVVELTSESRARQPTTRAWVIIRRAERAHRHPSDRQGRGARRQADRATRSDRTSRSHQSKERGMVADAR
jgi:hypothetical protein